MGKKKTRIQIKDLDVNLEELKKISPKVLAKIRDGWGFAIGPSSYACNTYGCQVMPTPPTMRCFFTAECSSPGGFGLAN
jgi:hypothetical protein